MASAQLLPSQLALHVLLLIVIAPADLPSPPSSPSSSSSRSTTSSNPRSASAHLDPAFASRLLHLLLRELLAPDPGRPLSFAELEQDILALDPGTVQGAAPALVRRLRAQLARLIDVAEFFGIVRALQSLVSERDDDIVEPSAWPLDRRSPLGLAVRRFGLASHALSFGAIVRGLSALPAWVSGQASTGASAPPDAREQAFTAYLAALHAGSDAALAHLHQFFSFPLPAPTAGAGAEDGTGDASAKEGRHHHALVNLASWHLAQGEREAAERALAEALRLARAASDRSALALCLSLGRRLAASLPRPSLGQASGNGNGGPARGTLEAEGVDEPFDELCAADQLVELGRRLGSDTPLSDVHALLAQTRGTLDRERFPPPGAQQVQTNAAAGAPAAGPVRLEVEDGAWEGLAGAVWAAGGEDCLARLRESFLLGLARPPDATDPARAAQGVRLASVLSLALRTATAYARPLDALELLFVPPSLALPDLSLAQYRAWAAVVWRVLDGWAAREGADGAREMVEVYGGDDGDGDEGEGGEQEIAKGTRRAVDQRLREAQKFKAAALPALALPPLLAAVQMAETHALFGLFRTATVGLADVLIDLGEDEFARGLVEGVYAQILAGDDLALKAFASLTLARALAVSSPASAASREANLALAASYATRAAESYSRLSPGAPEHRTALRLAAQLADALGREADRDGWASEWERVSGEGEGEGREERREVEDVVRLVARSVADLGVVVSLGLS